MLESSVPPDQAATPRRGQPEREYVSRPVGKHGIPPCCDGPGGKLTYRNQVCMPLGGRVQGIDHCIHRLVGALNAGGVGTIASCCGHKKMAGRIDLEDGRTLIVGHSDPWHPFSERDEGGAPLTDTLAPSDSLVWLSGVTCS